MENVQTDRSRPLQLTENPAFQRSNWRWQRIGWVAMAALVAAAAAGVFGQGPVARVEASAGGTLTARYERYARENTPVALRVDVAPAAFRDGRIELMIDREFLAAMQIVEVQPQPLRIVALSDSLLFRFDSTAATTPVPVHFTFRPVEIGTHTARLWMADGTALRLRQFVFP